MKLQISFFTFVSKQKKRCIQMSSNKNVVPEAKEALNRFKMEAAAEEGVQIHQRKFRNADIKPNFGK